MRRHGESEGCEGAECEVQRAREAMRECDVFTVVNPS